MSQESRSSIKSKLRDYILEEFLPGEDSSALEDTTPLITGGVLDSIATIKLAAFVEEQFLVELLPHELSPDYIDTIEGMTRTIEEKLPNRSA